MPRRTALASVVLLILVAACDPGALDMGFEPGVDDDPPEELSCAAEFALSGSVERTVEPGADDGCVPGGTWTFSLSLTDAGSCADIEYSPTYTYEVTGSVDDGWAYVYPADPDNSKMFLKVTSAGGDCNGNFEHWSADGTEMMLLKPHEVGGAINGKAFFERYSSSQQ